MPPFPDCMKGYYAGGFACIQNNDWYDMYIYPSYLMSNKCILEYTALSILCIHSLFHTNNKNVVQGYSYKIFH